MFRTLRLAPFPVHQTSRLIRSQCNLATLPSSCSSSSSSSCSSAAADKRKLQLAQKYEELKKSGKLDNFLSKKRKRNAGKDRRKMPRPDKTAA